MNDLQLALARGTLRSATRRRSCPPEPSPRPAGLPTALTSRPGRPAPARPSPASRSLQRRRVPASKPQGRGCVRLQSRCSPVGYRWRPEDGFQTMQPGYLAGATNALRKRG